jgi:HAD superfamily hydrolase (TIGR01509 family)
MSPTKTKAVIFDFDGVLVNSEIIALAELRDCLSEIGIRRDWNELIDTFLGASFEDIQSYVHRETGKPPEPAFRESWYARLFDRYSRDLAIMAGAQALFDQLDERAIRYCIASGGSYKRLTFALELTGLTSRFQDRAFSADSVERGKPEPDLFLFAVGKLGVEASECLVVEDAVAGVRAATAAGIRSIGFVGGDHLAERRVLHGQQLREVGAMAIIEDLGQTLKFVDRPAAKVAT